MEANNIPGSNSTIPGTNVSTKHPISAKAFLARTLFGWLLVPLGEESKAIVAELHGDPDYISHLRRPVSERTISLPDAASATAHVVEVARGMGISVSVCGNKKGPTFRFWKKASEARPERLRVDLKWALWSADETYWEERAPEALKRMKAAFKGEAAPVQISTAPGKEIRYGNVTVSKGKAEGVFATEWDEIDSLLATLDIQENDTEARAAANELLPRQSVTCEIGLERCFSIRARSFQRLLAKIDAEEEALLRQDQEEWSSIEASFKTDPNNQET